MPTHEVAFQVLEREEVRANQFTRAPLLRVVEWLDNMMAPWNREDEVQVGLFRVPIPRVEKRSFREAVPTRLPIATTRASARSMCGCKTML